jgi:hypothetical protein
VRNEGVVKGRTRERASGAGGGAAALRAALFQRLSSESRHKSVVVADVNPPPFFHAVGAGFHQIHIKTVCFMMPWNNCAVRNVRHFASNHRKCLSMNDLQPKSPIFQSSLIVPNRA